MRIRYMVRDGVRWEVVDAGAVEGSDLPSGRWRHERLLYFISRFEVRRSDAAPADWFLLDEDGIAELYELSTSVATRGPFDAALANVERVCTSG